uniref:Uncharacterized protein n=1 Tax=Acrobeloides nanus TaxID=290746 RepID=A0A914CY98_9BILA
MSSLIQKEFSQHWKEKSKRNGKGGWIKNLAMKIGRERSEEMVEMVVKSIAQIVKSKEILPLVEMEDGFERSEEMVEMVAKSIAQIAKLKEILPLVEMEDGFERSAKSV